MTTSFWYIFRVENWPEWSWLDQQIISKCETSILRLRVQIIKYILNLNLRNMFWHFVCKNIVQITGNTALSPLYWLWFRSVKFYYFYHCLVPHYQLCRVLCTHFTPLLAHNYLVRVLISGIRLQTEDRQAGYIVIWSNQSKNRFHAMILS